MRWQSRRRSGNVIDRRGVKAASGGLGFLGLALVVYLLGGDPTYFLSEGISRTIQSGSGVSRIPEEDQDALAEFVSVVLAETEDTWNAQFAKMGQDYPEPQLVLFTGGADSACGFAQAAIGPFYCPYDRNIYIDLDFYYDLKNRHGAPGDFAQAYVIAHEVGHHVQNVLGVLEDTQRMQARLDPAEANQISVRTELMADCLAGMWARDAGRKGLLEEGDVDEALNAASQIGDDRMQEQAQGYVVPDSFTHGTGAQRYHWFERGYQTEEMEYCNTFGPDFR